MPNTNHGLNKSRNTSISDNVNPSELDYELAGAQVALEDLYAKTKADPEAYEQDADNILKQAKAIRAARCVLSSFASGGRHLRISPQATTYDLAPSLKGRPEADLNSLAPRAIAYPENTIRQNAATLRVLAGALLAYPDMPAPLRPWDGPELMAQTAESLRACADSLTYCADLLSLLSEGGEWLTGRR